MSGYLCSSSHVRDDFVPAAVHAPLPPASSSSSLTVDNSSRRSRALLDVSIARSRPNLSVSGT